MIFEKDSWQEIYAAIKKNKLRTVLTAFGVFWGLFMLVVMLGAGSGLRNGVMGQFDHINPRTSFMWGQGTSMPYKGFPKGRGVQFQNEDMVALKNAVPEIELLSPRLEAPSWRKESQITRGKVTKSFRIYGDHPDLNKVEKRKIVQGRFLNFTDIQFSRKVVVIGLEVYRSLFKPGEKALGERIKLNGIYFSVIGVIKSYKSGWNAKRDNESVHMPLPTLQRTFNYGKRVGWFGVSAREGVEQKELETKIKNYLKARLRIHPDDRRAIGSHNVKKEFEKIGGLFNGIDLLIWIVGIGTLLAGVIGISNIMLIVVKERTQEIGIKRAIGAQPLNIVGIIMMESVFLTFISGYIGLAIGVGVIELAGSALASAPGDGIFTNPEINFGTALRALLIVVISGLVAGLVPALKAIRVKPIDALRDE